MILTVSMGHNIIRICLPWLAVPLTSGSWTLTLEPTPPRRPGPQDLHWRGFLLSREGAAVSNPRAVVFIDYQNVYRRARGGFGLEQEPHPAGQISPVELARRILTKDRREFRQLQEVRVYRGLPDSTRDPKGYGAARRQIAAWERDSLTRVFRRALRYPPAWPQERAQEKGVDVALAVDFVAMAVRGEYDVGILMSMDTDLIPAIEAVTMLIGDPHPSAEVAAWRSSGRSSGRLRIPGHNLWCHWLDLADYQAIADPRDYNIVTRATG